MKRRYRSGKTTTSVTGAGYPSSRLDLHSSSCERTEVGRPLPEYAGCPATAAEKVRNQEVYQQPDLHLLTGPQTR